MYDALYLQINVMYTEFDPEQISQLITIYSIEIQKTSSWHQ